MKFQDPSTGEEAVSAWLKKHHDDIESSFKTLKENLM